MHQKGPISVYLTPETDRALDERAQEEGATKPELIVEYVAEGLCLPEAVPPGGWQEPSVVMPSETSPRIMRTIYLDDRMEGLLASRAGSESMPKSRLVDRFCLEGLARPPSAGTIAARAKERRIAWHKGRIEHFQRLADEAAKRLASEIARFRTSCPHVRVNPSHVCEDCGATVTCSP